MGRAETPGTGNDEPRDMTGADERQASQRPPGQQPPAPADPAAAAPPQRKLGAMTTSAPTARRRELEHAIKHIPGTAPVQADLRVRLGEIEAEERSRARIWRRCGSCPERSKSAIWRSSRRPMTSSIF